MNIYISICTYMLGLHLVGVCAHVFRGVERVFYSEQERPEAFVKPCRGFEVSLSRVEGLGFRVSDLRFGFLGCRD